MADLRYKVVVDEEEAKRKIRELLKGSGVSSPLSGIADDSKKAASALDDASSANKRLREAQLANLDALREARTELAKQLKSQSDLNNQYTQGKIDLQTFRNEQTKLNAARKEEARQARETKRQLSQNSEYGKLTAELNRLRTESKNLLAEMVRLERQGYRNGAAYQLLETRSKSLVGQTQVLDRQIKTIDATVGQHYRKVGNYGDAISMVLPQISQFAGRLGLLGAAIAGVQKSFTSNLELEPLKQGINAVSSSSVQAEQTMDFLRKTSDRLGLQFTSTAESFKLWQGSAKFSNITATESKRIFESVATAGAKMKLSNDQVQGTFLALSQMMSKGKVQAEELRGQLAERLPGAFQLAAKAMGATEQELSKMLEKGEVISKDFLPKFATELEKTFGSDKTERVEGMQASINRLSNEFDKLWQSDRAQSFFTTVTDGLADLTSTIGKLVKSDSWKEFFLRLGGAVSGGIGGQIMDIGATGVNAVSNKDNLQRKTFFESFAALTRKEQLAEISRQEKLIADRERYNKALVDPSLRANLEKMKSLVNPEVKPEKKLVDQKALDKAQRESEKAAERDRLAFERQRSLQLEIDKINDGAYRRNLSRDQQEIASIKDKYAKIREEVRKFYADPKNKGKKVDSSGLPSSEKQEISDAVYKQNTVNILKVYQDDYANYIKYEDLKKEYGIKVANEQLGQYRSTYEKIAGEYAGLLAKQQMVGLSGLEKDRMDKIFEMIKGHSKKVEQDRLNDYLNAIKSAKTLNDKLLDIEREYQDKVKLVRDNAKGKDTSDQEKKLAKDRDRSISQVATDELTGTIEWEQIFSGMDEMGAKQIGNLLSIIERNFNNLKGKFDPVDLARIKKQLKEAENILIEKNPFGEFGKAVQVTFKDASDEGKQSADDIKTNWRKLAKATAKSFDFVSEAVHSAGFLKDALGDAGDAALATLDAVQITATAVAMAIDQAENASVILAIIKAALAVVQAVFSFIDGAAKKRNEALKKEEEYYEALSDTFDILIDKQKELFSVQPGKTAMDAYKEALDLVNSKTIANRKSLEAWFSQGASLFKHSNWYNYDKELGDVLSRQKLLNMSSQEWSDLLLKQPALWARLPEEVKKFGQSMIDAKEQSGELKTALQEAMTGLSLDDIKSEFDSLFSQADLTFSDISDSFYKHMQKAALRLVQDKAMTEKMQAWYDNVLKSMEDGDLTKNESDTLKAEYKAIVDAGNKKYQDIMDLIGYEGEGGGSGLKSSIKRELTEATASELTGVARSQTELIKRTFEESRSQGITMGKQLSVAMDQLTALNAIQANTLATANQSLKIAENTAQAVSELQSINKNLGGRY